MSYGRVSFLFCLILSIVMLFVSGWCAGAGILSGAGPGPAPAGVGGPASPIRVNQLGYYPDAPKKAVVVYPPGEQAGDTSHFYLTTMAGDTVFSGGLGPLRASGNSALRTRVADFSGFQRPGVYRILVPGLSPSYRFRIGGQVAAALSVASLKAYYYQRSAIPLEKEYAGIWARAAGHPDDRVLVHPSAASPGRPAGTVISTPGGWYDAGDYNKYIVNSGISMGTMLSAYEDFTPYYDTLRTNIPAAPGAVGMDRLPDLLDECLFNLRWMLTMQDPADGGVYNKCTNAVFDGMVMPGVTKAPRYVVAKGTAATLDFAAVMAQAARILRKFDGVLPGLSDSCLRAASRAWVWAEKNPDLAYDQTSMNRNFTPAVTTGAYGDRDFRDEWYWAAVELMVSCGMRDDIPKPALSGFRKVIGERMADAASLPSWSSVHLLGDYTLLRYQCDPSGLARQHVLLLADGYLQSPSVAFQTVMGGRGHDFVWGSNAVAANQGVLLINAWMLTKEGKYLDGALSNLDYLLGRNATGYCFVTDMGSYSPMHPHHRPSVSDGIEAPVPGLLVGGPNPGRQDGQLYTWTEPETAYLDAAPAYASNEIAINWNAPLVYLAGGLECLQWLAGYTGKSR